MGANLSCNPLPKTCTKFESNPSLLVLRCLIVIVRHAASLLAPLASAGPLFGLSFPLLRQQLRRQLLPLLRHRRRCAAARAQRVLGGGQRLGGGVAGGPLVIRSAAIVAVANACGAAVVRAGLAMLREADGKALGLRDDVLFYSAVHIASTHVHLLCQQQRHVVRKYLPDRKCREGVHGIANASKRWASIGRLAVAATQAAMNICMLALRQRRCLRAPAISL